MNEEKKILLEIIGLPEKELKKNKIGILVRSTLPILLTENLLSESEIKKLQEATYSKLTFDMNYPVLKKINPKLSLEENRMVNYYTRYYAGIYENDNGEYLISSEWYERNLEYYIKWLKRKVIN